MSNFPQMNDESREQLLKEAYRITSMGRIGKHVVTFVCECVARGTDPKMALESFDLASRTGDTNLPMSILWKWINFPEPGILDELSKAFGIDIVKTAEKMKNDSE